MEIKEMPPQEPVILSTEGIKVVKTSRGFNFEVKQTNLDVPTLETKIVEIMDMLDRVDVGRGE